MADLYTLGNFTLDDIVLHDGRSWMNSPGGNALYAALGAQVWNRNVGLIARLGNDLPPAYRATLDTLDLELNLIPVDAPSIHSWALYEADGTRQFVNHKRSGDNDTLSLRASEVPPSCLAARAFHIAPMPILRQTELVEGLKTANHLVSLDPHEWWIPHNEELLFELVGRVDFFLPSREEAELLYGRNDPEQAIRAFGELGARAVVIKLGQDGSLLYGATSKHVTHVPIHPCTAIDVTGAGDAYCGGFLAGYLETRDPLLAACCGTVSASFCVEHFGVVPERHPTRVEANTRLAFMKEKIKRV